VYGDFRKLIETLDFEEYDGKVLVTRYEFDGNDLVIGFTVHPGAEAAPSPWTVTCEGVRRHRLTEQTGVFNVEIVDEHIVITACKDRQVELYFAGKAPNPYEAIGRLLVAHNQATKGWLSFWEVIAAGMPLHELFATAGGLIARGSRRILQPYLDALRAGGVDAYFANEREPLWWVSNSPVLSALIFEKNYVVAERFSVSRD
jgi:hypothetical protein